MLVGYGLVVGLPGMGDSAGSPITTRLLGSMMQNMGFGDGAAQGQRGWSMAAVMVTANLPAFAKPGNRIDVDVNPVGDATGVRGGGHAAADGPGSGGQAGLWRWPRERWPPLRLHRPGGRAARVTSGTPTAGRITGGALVERGSGYVLNTAETIHLTLHHPDFTTASRVAAAVNAAVGQKVATQEDNATVRVTVPTDFPGGTAALLAQAEQASATPDRPTAKVVIDSRSGTIVAGADIPIAPTSIRHGGVTTRVTETPMVSQPPPFSNAGRTVVVPRTTIEVDEGLGTGALDIPPGTTVGSLMRRLDESGVGVIDRMAILHALKDSGALQAELVGN